jgi:hypothetical protein
MSATVADIAQPSDMAGFHSERRPLPSPRRRVSAYGADRGYSFAGAAGAMTMSCPERPTVMTRWARRPRRWARRVRDTAPMSYSRVDVDGWADAVANLHATTARDPSDQRAASEAMANLWSAFGYQDAPTDVLRMLVAATEVGYMTALRDVRHGDFDDEILDWRPDLVDQ